jgi:hypothetical protein
MEEKWRILNYIADLRYVIFVPTKRTNPSSRRTPAAVICPAIGRRLTVIKVIGMSGKPTFMACQADSGQSSVQLAEPNSRGGFKSRPSSGGKCTIKEITILLPILNTTMV